LNNSSLLPLAIQAAEKACAEILRVYETADFSIELKSDASPLTRADKLAHTAIVASLSATGLPVLSEEGKTILYAERKQWLRFWMVDPLDGTKEFIKRNGEFTVNIALIEQGKPVLGVVAVPVTSEVFFGAVGMGAFKKTNGVDVQLPIRATVNPKSKNLRVVASRSHSNQETESFINSLHEPVLVSKGSSLKFMMLADGQADIYPRFAPTMEWDTAAAHAIVNQCGFKVLKQGSNEELTYNKEDLLNPHFLVI
jgi:3'(2'), 5'-bisphosphate nucleotidase